METSVAPHHMYYIINKSAHLASAGIMSAPVHELAK